MVLRKFSFCRYLFVRHCHNLPQMLLLQSGTAAIALQPPLDHLLRQPTLVLRLLFSNIVEPVGTRSCLLPATKGLLRVIYESEHLELRVEELAGNKKVPIVLDLESPVASPPLLGTFKSPSILPFLSRHIVRSFEMLPRPCTKAPVLLVFLLLVNTLSCL
jgi:hypothetical protein